MYTYPDPDPGKMPYTQRIEGSSSNESQQKQPSDFDNTIPSSLNPPTHFKVNGVEVNYLAEKAKGTITEEVVKFLKNTPKYGAQAIAGIVGVPLYVASVLIGGSLSSATMLIGLVIAIPLAGMSASTAAIAGLATGIGAAQGAKLGSELGALLGYGFTVGGLEMSALLPKLIFMHTVGNLGAGLTGFALTGKRNSVLNEKLFEKLEDSFLASSRSIDLVQASIIKKATGAI